MYYSEPKRHLGSCKLLHAGKFDMLCLMLQTIHFFGDKTDKGGNDHELYEDSRVVGHTVTSPGDTQVQLQKVLGIEC